MRFTSSAAFVTLLFASLSPSHAEDQLARVRKAVERCTLDQAGTKPFHLKATLAPSLERDKDSGRTGEVEIWWVSPGKWRREVTSPQFHQIEIVDGSTDWQKNDGGYFPEWLREIAIALVKPVPDVDHLLERLKTAEFMIVPDMTHSSHWSWVVMGTDGTVSKGIGAGVYLLGDGSYRSGGELGWWASLSDTSDFHGRMVARKVTASAGGPEVTAQVTTLEDLKQPAPQLFDTSSSRSDPILQTRVLDELSARKNLIPTDAAAWPAIAQGPLEGVLIAEVIIDRTGRVHEIGTVLSDNPGLIDASRDRIRNMIFKPYVVDGEPSQVVTTITMPFTTVRPPGVENFASAKTFFDRGRALGFPAAAAGPSYTLRAEFTTRGSSGQVETGTYRDTWVSDSEWRREADFGKSRFIRSRDGEKRYLLAEGPDAALLRILFKEMEPIPATDVFADSDWRAKHDLVAGVSAVRLASGYENPDGVLDPDARAFWFDDAGRLVKTHGYGVDSLRQDFSDFRGVSVARRIDVLKDGKLAMRIQVTQLTPAGTVDASSFALKGHEWVRQWTEEVR